MVLIPLGCAAFGAGTLDEEHSSNIEGILGDGVLCLLQDVVFMKKSSSELTSLHEGDTDRTGDCPAGTVGGDPRHWCDHEINSGPEPKHFWWPKKCGSTSWQYCNDCDPCLSIRRACWNNIAQLEYYGDNPPEDTSWQLTGEWLGAMTKEECAQAVLDGPCENKWFFLYGDVEGEKLNQCACVNPMMNSARWDLSESGSCDSAEPHRRTGWNNEVGLYGPVGVGRLEGHTTLEWEAPGTPATTLEPTPQPTPQPTPAPSASCHYSCLGGAGNVRVKKCSAPECSGCSAELRAENCD